MSTTAPAPSARRISVTISTQAGQSLEGVDLEFFVDGKPWGSIVRSTGCPTIEVPGAKTLEVRGHYQGVTFKHTFGAHESDYKIVAPIAQKVNTPPPGPPEARCPDGTTGQPCVTCQIAGVTVRICG